MKNIFFMLKCFVVLVAMITGIVVGGWGLWYALSNALIFILCFIISLVGLGFSLYALYVVADKLR